MHFFALRDPSKSESKSAYSALHFSTVLTFRPFQGQFAEHAPGIPTLPRNSSSTRLPRFKTLPKITNRSPTERQSALPWKHSRTLESSPTPSKIGKRNVLRTKRSPTCVSISASAMTVASKTKTLLLNKDTEPPPMLNRIRTTTMSEHYF